MIETLANRFVEFLVDVSTLDSKIVLLVILIVISVIVITGIFEGAFLRSKQAGMDLKSVPVSIEGSKTLPAKNYVSYNLGLAGKPDALIVEDGYIIPVEIKPLAKKVRDRYVAQLLVYMRLIEEFEKNKPPYGYLIIGQNFKKVKIYNTDSRQLWLQKMLNEMRDIINGTPSVPTLHPNKCPKCSVKNICAFKDEPSVNNVSV